MRPRHAIRTAVMATLTTAAIATPASALASETISSSFTEAGGARLRRPQRGDEPECGARWRERGDGQWGHIRGHGRNGQRSPVITPGENLYVEVGGDGISSANGANITYGGYNGGGDGGEQFFLFASPPEAVVEVELLTFVPVRLPLLH